LEGPNIEAVIIKLPARTLVLLDNLKYLIIRHMSGAIVFD